MGKARDMGFPSAKVEVEAARFGSASVKPEVLKNAEASSEEVKR
jgi:hypothetical protein